jgi:hypothetical protein
MPATGRPEDSHAEQNSTGRRPAAAADYASYAAFLRQHQGQARLRLMDRQEARGAVVEESVAPLEGGRSWSFTRTRIEMVRSAEWRGGEGSPDPGTGCGDEDEGRGIGGVGEQKEVGGEGGAKEDEAGEGKEGGSEQSTLAGEDDDEDQDKKIETKRTVAVNVEEVRDIEKCEDRSEAAQAPAGRPQVRWRSLRQKILRPWRGKLQPMKKQPTFRVWVPSQQPMQVTVERSTVATDQAPDNRSNGYWESHPSVLLNETAEEAVKRQRMEKNFRDRGGQRCRGCFPWYLVLMLFALAVVLLPWMILWDCLKSGVTKLKERALRWKQARRVEGGVAG